MTRALHSPRTAQQGMVLFISLIVLVALALGALAMFRGSMGTTLVATNVASRQGALSLADTGVQIAATDIATRAGLATVNSDDLNNGYFSSIPAA
jgi:Tfp pilus assembly protein PilX